MKTMSITVDVPASPERVWQVMSDVERWPQWTASISSVRLRAPALAVGARAWIKQPSFPPALWTVTSLAPGHGFAWVNSAPGVRVLASHRIEPTHTGSRVTLSLEYSGMLGGLLARLTRSITERYLRLEADGLAAESRRATANDGAAARS
jgi:uncharacterized membrane protein